MQTGMKKLTNRFSKELLISCFGCKWFFYLLLPYFSTTPHCTNKN